MTARRTDDAPARFLLRFDDAAPGMAWSVWDRVEALLDRHGVRPLVAVVPDNRDPNLAVEPEAPDFWDRVRGWQDKGWSIGLHGHTHVYATDRAGLVGLNRRSEFAGLPQDQQEAKLRAGLAVFAAHGVRADAWVAPAHSFDRATLLALDRVGLRVVSDGFHARPATDRHGIAWVPQRLWRLEPRWRGVWTVCHHVNGWSDADVAAFGQDLERFAGRFASLPDAVADAAHRRLGGLDRVAAWSWRTRLRTRQRAARVRDLVLGRR